MKKLRNGVPSGMGAILQPQFLFKTKTRLWVHNILSYYKSPATMAGPMPDGTGVK